MTSCGDRYEGEMTVTPELASAWLTLKMPSGHSRGGGEKIARFAAEMAMGQWNAEVERPVWIRHGRLMDGWHRLNAVVMTQQSVTLRVLVE